MNDLSLQGSAVAALQRIRDLVLPPAQLAHLSRLLCAIVFANSPLSSDACRLLHRVHSNTNWALWALQNIPPGLVFAEFKTKMLKQ
jgi:hypothetical protein